MLGRAKQAYEAKKPPNPPAAAGVGKSYLEQKLFPSSSPSASQGGNIGGYYRKPPFGGSSALDSKPPPPRSSTMATPPFKPRSANIVQPPKSRTSPRAALSESSKSFTSLYNTSDSFREEEQPVYFDDNDFSDDDKLDLEYEHPSVLPQLQKLPRPKPVGEAENTPPGTNATCVSWSQSSPSHFVPPPRPRAEAAGNLSTKRAAPTDGALGHVPVAKKRSMPKHWRIQPEVKVEEPLETRVPTHISAMATPGSRSKDPLPWNQTASAVKVQKKQLKDQHKKPTPPSADEPPPHRAPPHEPAKPRAPTKASPALLLSKEQRHVKNLVCTKNASVFFTGPAGTGKSVLMRVIIQELKKKFARDPERLGVTASTGLAACNIGGMTLHSFAGIGLGKEDAQSLVKKIRRNPKAKNRWLKTKTLIIDEVSMVDAELFDKLSQIGRIIRNNGRPWGGIQLVITGDFFQLPPVPDGDKKREVKFAFEASTWNTSIDHTIGLTEVFRQKDPEFARMLNEMRLGKITEQTVQSFKSLSRPLQFDDGLEFTELFPTRQEVEGSNSRRLKDLTGKIFRYDALDTGDPTYRDKLLQNMMAPKTIELKKNAQVMLIKNLDEGLVNGSLGTVVGFMNQRTYGLGGGADSYGSSGLTDDDMAQDTRKRAAMLNQYIQEGTGGQDTKEYPLVRFHATDGSQKDILCVPEEWKVELPTGEVQASRKQLPLILAWALSIHKAQGQTLERVKVDLGKVFEKGQAYVALSRATSQQGLQVLRFEKHKVMAHPRVVQFYDKLYSAEAAVKKKGASSILDFACKVEPGLEDLLSQKGANMVDSDDEREAMAAYG